MFQIFAARMFEQRVLTAYRERVAADRQLQLLQELEDEEQAKEQREKAKQKIKDKKKRQKELYPINSGPSEYRKRRQRMPCWRKLLLRRRSLNY